MNLFSHAPFIRILPAFICGVALSFFTCIPDLYIESVLFSSILGFFCWNKSALKLQYSFKFVAASLLLIVFFSFGFLLNREKAKTERKGFDSKFVEYPFAIAEVKGISVRTTKSNRVEINVISVFGNNGKRTTNLKAYFYFSDSLVGKLNVGDKILFKNKIKSIPKPANPGQFDFNYFSSLKRIYCQYRLKNNEWKVIERNTSFNLLNASRDLRDRLLKCYSDAGIHGQDYAVISALVLGYDDEIDTDLMKAFQASGTLHILSVSGMHVGIVFTILAFLFRKMETRAGWKVVRVVAMIIIIWFYAMLTGFSPSVIRSAMMFTFILFGKSLNRNSNIYNTLAASILVICVCFDPLLLFEPGFQLSYLAVAGIAFLYKPIYNWFYIKNKFGNAIWNLTAVSLAAQLATFPVSLYYFHQFPNYFIPANLLIIPVSTIAIFGGLLLLAISPFHWLSLKFGIVLKFVIELQNWLAFLFKRMPFAVTDELHLTLPEMMTLYLFLLVMVFYFLYRSMTLLRTSVIVLILFISLKSLGLFYITQRKQLIVYSSQFTAIELVDGKSTFLFYPQKDSLNVFRISNDMHTKFGLKRTDRMEFELNSIAVNRKYLILEKIYFEMDSSLKSNYLKLYTNNVQTKFSYNYFSQTKEEAINLRKQAFTTSFN